MGRDATMNHLVKDSREIHCIRFIKFRRYAIGKGRERYLHVYDLRLARSRKQERIFLLDEGFVRFTPEALLSYSCTRMSHDPSQIGLKIIVRNSELLTKVFEHS